MPHKKQTAYNSKYLLITIIIGTILLSSYAFISFPMGLSYNIIKVIFSLLLIVIFAAECFPHKFHQLIHNKKGAAFFLKNKQLLFFAFLFLSILTFNLTILFEVWKGGEITNKFSTIGGIIPYGDAFNYFSGASHLIDKGTLLKVSAYRPLASCYWAVLLKITGQDVGITMLINLLLVSISMFLVTQTIFKYWKYTAAFLAGILLCCFYIRSNGMLLTEPVGLLVGNLSFIFLIEAVFSKSKKKALWGFLLLCFALNIRAGAMFAVPFAILYLGYIFRENKFFDFKTSFLGVLITLAVFSFPAFLLSQIGPKEGYAYQGNFSYTIYAIVNGGGEWKKALKDHPELRRKPIEKRIEMVYQYAWEDFQEQPSVFFITVINSLIDVIKNPLDFFIASDFIFFKYILYLPFIAAFIGLYMLRKEPKFQALLLIPLMVLAVFLSAPIVEGAGLRVFAASAAFNIAFVAFGAFVIIQYVRNYANNTNFYINDNNTSLGQQNLAYIFSTIILISISFGPLLIKATVPSLDFSEYMENACESEMKIFRNNKSILVSFVEKKGTSPAVAPELSIPNFKKYYKCAFRRNTAFEENTYLTAGVDLLSDKIQSGDYFFFEEDIRTIDDEFFMVCTYDLPGDKYRPFGAKLYGKNQQKTLVKNDKTFNFKTIDKYIDMKGVKTKGNNEIIATDSKWGNAGAASTNILPENIDGAIEILVPNITDIKAIGLSATNKNADLKTIDFAFCLFRNELRIYEKGRLIKFPEKIDLDVEDKLQIQRIDNKIYYLKNDEVLYASKRKENCQLLIDIAFFSEAANFKNIQTSF